MSYEENSLRTSPGLTSRGFFNAMPIAAPRPCVHPGCRTLTARGKCDTHRQKAIADDVERRGTAHERGYTAEWQRERVVWLRMHPLCARCLPTMVTPATVIDHIKPHKGDMTVFWDRDNWQSLCKPCHDRKTATEDSRFARSKVGGV